MTNLFKSVGGYMLGVCFLAGIALVLAILVKGGVWLSEHVYPWLERCSSIALTVMLFGLLPLALVRRARAFAGLSIFAGSFVLGLTAWTLCLLICHEAWGVTGTLIGVVLGGVGVVPLAFLGLLFDGTWSDVGQLLLFVLITLAARMLGAWIMAKAEALPSET